MVTQSAKGEPYHVGKNLLEGATTIAKVAVALKKKHAFWPCPLKKPVNRASGDDGGGAVVEDSEAQANAFGAAKDGAGKAAAAKKADATDALAKKDEEKGAAPVAAAATREDTGAETPEPSNADGPEDTSAAADSADAAGAAAPSIANDDSDPLSVLRPAFEKDYATTVGGGGSCLTLLLSVLQKITCGSALQSAQSGLASATAG